MATNLPRHAALAALLADFAAFSRACYPRRALRPYQLAAAAPVLAAVDARRGGHFVILFSRQAGKDEVLAQVQAFLLARYQRRGGGIVMATPTYRPQALISRRRLVARTATPLHARAHGADSYRWVVGRAGVSFLSAEPGANVRGETADRLLIANEAQDIEPAIWDARFAPMTASTHAPSVFSGTPWGAGSLLAREMRHAESGAPDTGLFRADWQLVAAAVPAYGDHVRERIALLGAQHPFIRTEYGLEELEAAGGLFDARRQAQMRGVHARRSTAVPGAHYALLLDIGGGDDASAEYRVLSAEDEGTSDGALEVSAARVPALPKTQHATRNTQHATRDSTALTVVEVDLGTVKDPLVRKPTYRVVDRAVWTGTPHAALLPQLLDLARTVWHARTVVVDATGLGAGLASFLTAALAPACTVVPYVFSQQSKSALGWAFLGAVESGRYKEYAADGAADTALFWAQVAACTFTVVPGPGKLLRWSVPARAGHDDLLVSAALVGALDAQDWRPRAVAVRTRQDFA